MLMKSCTTMFGIRSYSITVCLPPPIFTGQFFKMFSMDVSSNLLPSAAMVFWTMRASGPAYLASRRNRCLRIGYLVIWLFGYLVIWLFGTRDAEVATAKSKRDMGDWDACGQRDTHQPLMSM